MDDKCREMCYDILKGGKKELFDSIIGAMVDDIRGEILSTEDKDALYRMVVEAKAIQFVRDQIIMGYESIKKQKER